MEKVEEMSRIEQLEEYIKNMKDVEKKHDVKMKNFIVISDLGVMSYCDAPNMMSLLTLYIKERRDQGVLTDDMIEQIVKIAKMSEEELENESKRMLKEMLESLKNDLTEKKGDN